MSYIYSFLQFVLNIYSHIIYYFNYIYNIYFNHKVTDIFQIHSISNNNTKKYLHDSNCDIRELYKEKIYWSIDGNNYIFPIKKDTVYFFPPYSFQEMRCCIKDNKILTAFIKSENQFENVTQYIKSLAGPKQNFYKDLSFNINTFDIFPQCKKTLYIMTDKKQFDFDLSKDNIIEL